MESAARPPQRDSVVWDEDVVEDDRLRVGGTHAECPPVVGERHAGSSEGNGEVDNLPAFFGILERSRCHQHVALWQTAGERLFSADAEASVSPLGRAVG